MHTDETESTAMKVYCFGGIAMSATDDGYFCSNLPIVVTSSNQHEAEKLARDLLLKQLPSSKGYEKHALIYFAAFTMSLEDYKKSVDMNLHGSNLLIHAETAEDFEM